VTNFNDERSSQVKFGLKGKILLTPTQGSTPASGSIPDAPLLPRGTSKAAIIFGHFYMFHFLLFVTCCKVIYLPSHVVGHEGEFQDSSFPVWTQA
jgi:hypothetical protein